MNIRSLPKNSEKLELLVHQLPNRPDVILVSETWLDENLAQSYNLPGYRLETSSPDQTRGKGSAIYINSSILYDRRNNLETNRLEFQSVFIELKIPNKKNLVIGSSYRSPSFSVTDYLEYLELTLYQINLEQKPCILGGDYNVDILKHASSETSAVFLNTFGALGFFPCISLPTRVGLQSSSLIDNFFSNDPSIVKNSNVVISDISDHMPITLTINRVTKKEKNSSAQDQLSFDFRKIGILKTALTTKLAQIMHTQDAETATSLLVTTINSEIHKLSTKKSNRRTTPVQPWISFALVKSINKKNELYKQSLRNPTNENKHQYIIYRNRLNSVIRTSKKLYFERKLNEHKSNPVKLWQTLFFLVHKKQERANLPSLYNYENREITSPGDIADKFNSYFGSIASNLDKKITQTNIDPMTYMENNPETADSFSLSPTSIPTILGLIQDLPSSSATSDNLTPKILKQISGSLAPSLLHVYNLCLASGTFPAVFKKSVVVPIYKSGDPSLFNNYRPISLLNILSKILEKIVFAQLTEHLTANNILNNIQFGFRKFHSSFMPVSLLHDQVTSSLSNKETSAAIYLDFSKAFDTVNHHILLKKLAYYGIRNSSLAFFQSYLENRTQILKYNSTFSSAPITISHGVPQGSVLGPALFLLYINDIVTSTQGCNFLQFADDTVVIFSAKNVSDLQDKINISLPKITQWLSTNRLSINAKKSAYQLFSNSSNQPNINVSLNCEPISRQAKVKYLGILIDEKFKWEPQIRTVENTISRNIGLIFRTRNNLKPGHVILLYNALILPHLTFGLQAWGSTFPSRLHRLNILQKKAVRLIDNADRLAPSSPIFKKHGLIKLPDLFKLTQMNILHSFLNHTLPEPLASKLVRSPTPRERRVRQHRHFHVPFTAFVYRKFSLFHSAPRIWNENLASKIIDINDIPHSKIAFKKVTKKMFLDQY